VRTHGLPYCYCYNSRFFLQTPTTTVPSMYCAPQGAHLATKWLPRTYLVTTSAVLMHGRTTAPTAELCQHTACHHTRESQAHQRGAQAHQRDHTAVPLLLHSGLLAS
jgi:hypothetical protein